MAVRPIFSVTDKNSTVPATSGAALTAEFATQAFPESSNKRRAVTFYPANRASVPNATPVELFVDGLQFFRFRLAQDSVVHLSITATVWTTTAANAVTFKIEQGVRNTTGVLTLLANGTNTKFPTAATQTLVVSTSGESIILTYTGNAEVQRVVALAQVLEITDIG